MKKAKKRIPAWIIYFLIVAVTLEIAPYLISFPLLGHSFSRSELRSRIGEKNETEAVDEKHDNANENNHQNEYLGDHILHPYLGFVSIPHPSYNDFDFPGIDPLVKKNTEQVNICLMGGSVAKDVYAYSADRIKSNFRNSDKYKNKKINIVVFALGGFKQPQQLMALNYFMALGAEFDFVINLDGFNEVVLPYSDNLPFHVFPSYPRHWNIYSRKKLDSKITLLLGKQAVIKEEIENHQQFMAKSILSYSNFCLFIWQIMENNSKSNLSTIESQLRLSLKNVESDYQATGIYTSIEDTTSFFEEQAIFWKRASLQIHHVSQSSGFQYFHFLQPNQYVNNSKVLTKKEIEIAYESGPFSYKYAAQKGYPFLIREGKTLIDSGVQFTDLTMMFENEPRTVYNDKCCHFNQLGYDLIADKITSTILSHTLE